MLDLPTPSSPATSSRTSRFIAPAGSTVALAIRSFGWPCPGCHLKSGRDRKLHEPGSKFRGGRPWSRGAPQVTGVRASCNTAQERRLDDGKLTANTCSYSPERSPPRRRRTRGTLPAAPRWTRDGSAVPPPSPTSACPTTTLPGPRRPTGPTGPEQPPPNPRSTPVLPAASLVSKIPRSSSPGRAAAPRRPRPSVPRQPPRCTGLPRAARGPRVLAGPSARRESSQEGARARKRTGHGLRNQPQRVREDPR